MKKIIPLIYFAALLMSGCDTVTSDGDLRKLNVKLVTIDNKSAVIDLKKLINNYKSVSVPETSGAKYFADQYVKVSSTASSPSQFSFTIKEKDNSNAEVNVQLSKQAECENSEAFTYIKISNKDVLVVNLLNNPEFCGFDIFSAKPGEIGFASDRPGDVSQNADAVNVDICACGTEGRHAILTYAPPTGFVGQVKFKYYLHVNASGAENDEELFYDPKFSQYFSAHEAVIDVTN